MSFNRKRSFTGHSGSERGPHPAKRFDKRPRKSKYQEDPPNWEKSKDVYLDRYNSDMTLAISESGFGANPISERGFAYLWHGVRATHGINSGKVCFETKLTANSKVQLPPHEQVKQSMNVLRIGWSCDFTSLDLGEEKCSYGYGGTGKASVANKFTNYGEKFAVGDVITSYVSFENHIVTISYSKNGKYLGPAFTFREEELNDGSLFPHIFTKNVEFEVNFGQLEKSMCDVRSDYVFIGNVSLDYRHRGVLPPEKKEDCKVIMMVGLPACGKTVWAEKYCQQHPEMNFNFVGTNRIIDKMKVMGLPRNRNYHGRWEMLIDRSSKCMNEMLLIAPVKKRNYILDQTNVYPSARLRKMRPFEGFKTEAVVIVPTDEEYQRRLGLQKRLEGKDVPAHAILEMKANFTIPKADDIFDEITFPELDRDKASDLVSYYNEEGMAAKRQGNTSHGPPKGFNVPPSPMSTPRHEHSGSRERSYSVSSDGSISSESSDNSRNRGQQGYDRDAYRKDSYSSHSRSVSSNSSLRSHDSGRGEGCEQLDSRGSNRFHSASEQKSRSFDSSREHDGGSYGGHSTNNRPSSADRNYHDSKRYNTNSSQQYSDHSNKYNNERHDLNDFSNDRKYDGQRGMSSGTADRHKSSYASSQMSAKNSSGYGNQGQASYTPKYEFSPPHPPPPGNYSLPPPGNYGSPPPGNYSSPPPGDYSSPPPGNYGSPPPGNYGSPPPGNYGSHLPGYYNSPPPNSNQGGHYGPSSSKDYGTSHSYYGPGSRYNDTRDRKY